MRDVETDDERITRSLLISGATVAIAYILLMILWSFVSDGKDGVLEVYKLLTHGGKALKTHIILIILLTAFIPVIVVPYGSLVYWALSKYKLLSYFSVVFSSLVPAALLGIAYRDYVIFVVLSYFCIWHSSVSWWYVRRSDGI